MDCGGRWEEEKTAELAVIAHSKHRRRFDGVVAMDVAAAPRQGAIEMLMQHEKLALRLPLLSSSASSCKYTEIKLPLFVYSTTPHTH